MLNIKLVTQESQRVLGNKITQIQIMEINYLPRGGQGKESFPPFPVNR